MNCCYNWATTATCCTFAENLWHVAALPRSHFGSLPIWVTFHSSRCSSVTIPQEGSTCAGVMLFIMLQLYVRVFCALDFKAAFKIPFTQRSCLYFNAQISCHQVPCNYYSFPLPNEHGTHTIDEDFLFLPCLCVGWWELSACEHLATRRHAAHTNSVWSTACCFIEGGFN